MPAVIFQTTDAINNRLVDESHKRKMNKSQFIRMIIDSYFEYIDSIDDDEIEIDTHDDAHDVIMQIKELLDTYQ